MSQSIEKIAYSPREACVQLVPGVVLYREVSGKKELWRVVKKIESKHGSNLNYLENIEHGDMFSPFYLMPTYKFYVLKHSKIKLSTDFMGLPVPGTIIVRK